MTAAHIHTATLADLPAVAQLFDAYRQFYQYPSDLALASAYWLVRHSHISRIPSRTEPASGSPGPDRSAQPGDGAQG